MAKEYQIRINRSPVKYLDVMDKYAIDDFATICADNPDDAVDLVCVDTEILMNQYSYYQMKKHFKEQSQ